MLVVGKVLRVNLPFLQRLYLPSSIIGGLVGLAVMCAAGEAVPGEFRAAMQKTPGFLINVIFATIFLGSAIPKVHDFVLFALPQFCMGQIIAWGQYVLGLGLAGFVFVRVFDVPAALDFLVASAVATIQPKVVAANWQPLTILVLAGAIWSVGCVLFLGPKLFLYAWFERSIAEFGQATGVTATGLMLAAAHGRSGEQDAGGDELRLQAAAARAVHGRRTLDGSGEEVRLLGGCSFAREML